MKTFARIDTGRVAEIILPMSYDVDAPLAPNPENPPEGWPAFKAGDEVPIDKRFSPDIVAALVDITDVVNVKVGDAYSGGQFLPYTPPPPTPAEVLARNTRTRDDALSLATKRIAPLQDAVDLDMATAAETAALASWKRYRVDVNRVDLNSVSPNWPVEPA
jgi:hypothetical protein